MKDDRQGLPFLAFLILSPLLLLISFFTMIGAGISALVLGGDRGQRLVAKSPSLYVSVTLGIIAVVVIVLAVTAIS